MPDISTTIQQRILLAIDREPQTFQSLLRWSGLTRVVLTGVLRGMEWQGLITCDGERYVRRGKEETA